MKKALTMLALMLPMLAFAQWRVGVNGGAGISDEIAQNNPMIVRVVDGLATHNDSFLHRDRYTLDSEKLIVSALNKFLGI